MASLAPLPLQSPRVLDQKVATFTQEQQQQQQQKQQQQQQQNNNNQEPLRCPRCDSSNTKFCYYNNYSLSQPRHFCKACKRYWTRGGTLRSVPVGGGCRKNKRVKRPSNNSNNNTSSMITTTNNNTNYSNNNLHDGSVNSLPSPNNTNHSNIHDLINTSASNPLFYGINHGSNHHNFMNNFPFSRYDLPQINGVGLGFSSGLVHNDNINGDFRNGLSLNPHNNNNKHIFQDLISSNPNSSSISSLLASSFQMKSGGNNFETILPSYEGNHHMKGGMFMKEVKMELEGQNRAMDQHWSAPSQNLLDQSNMGSSPSSDPSNVWGSGPNLGSWVDSSQNNLGCSSFPSLI